jgi:hypothetical protein
MSNNKNFRSIIKPISDGLNYIDFSLDAIEQPPKYIELIAYGIHQNKSGQHQQELYILDCNLFGQSLICHSAADNSFLNFCHGLIFSTDQLNINGLFRCYFNPVIKNITSGYIALYFVLHY